MLQNSDTDNLGRKSVMKRILSTFSCLDIEDDVVSMGIKLLYLSHSVSILLWLLSFVLIMVQICENDKFSLETAPLFIPMWFGSCLGIVSGILVCQKVCNNAVLVSRERRLFMRAQGIESDLEFIDYDSLPLMRRLFCLDVVSVVTFVVAFVAQILFYLWFVDELLGIWEALLPICCLVGLYLLYMFTVRVFSMRACVMATLIAVQLVSA